MSNGPIPWYSDIFTGERWDDLRFPAAAINPVGQAAPPTLNTSNGLLEFAASGTETIAFQVQLPHSWLQSSTLKPHVHFRKKTQGAGNVLWRFTYEFVNAGDVYTDTPATLDGTSTSPYGADDGAALRHLITPLGDITMSGKRVSCMALCTLSRIGDDDLDTYAGVAQLLEFDVHYQVDSLGSEVEYVKQNTYGTVGL